MWDRKLLIDRAVMLCRRRGLDQPDNRNAAYVTIHLISEVVYQQPKRRQDFVDDVHKALFNATSGLHAEA